MKGNALPLSPASPVGIGDIRVGAVALKRTLTVGKRNRVVPEEWVKTVWFMCRNIGVTRVEAEAMFAVASAGSRFFPAPIEFIEFRGAARDKLTATAKRSPRQAASLKGKAPGANPQPPETVDPADLHKLHEFLKGKDEG